MKKNVNFNKNQIINRMETEMGMEMEMEMEKISVIMTKNKIRRQMNAVNIQDQTKGLKMRVVFPQIEITHQALVKIKRRILLNPH